MATALETSDIQKNPALRRWWIHLQLEQRHGLTWRGAAARMGKSHQALIKTANGAASLAIETALAELCGVAPEWLFPEHYAQNGARLRRVLASAPKHSGAATSGNAESEQAA